MMAAYQNYQTLDFRKLRINRMNLFLDFLKSSGMIPQTPEKERRR
jgi:hypothetical protein